MPLECVCCGCGRLRNVAAVVAGDSNVVTCDACEAIMVVQPEEDEEEEEVSADLDRCPHCETCDTINEAGGAEWCSMCGLDPSEEGLPSAEIAHLWHKDSGIRGHLEKDHHKAENASGVFVRTRCGPHCIHADRCEQDTKNFIFCFHQHRNGLKLGPEMIRGDERNTSLVPSTTSTSSSTTIQAKGTATACAAGGWLEKHVIGTTYESSNSEGHTNTGG
jgi:hypothetical protein